MSLSEVAEKSQLDQKEGLIAAGLGLLVGFSIYKVYKSHKELIEPEIILEDSQADALLGTNSNEKKDEEIDLQLEQKQKSVNQGYIEKNSKRLRQLVAQRQNLADELLMNSRVKICRVTHLTDLFSETKQYLNPLSEEAVKEIGSDLDYFLPNQSFVTETNFVLQEKFYSDTLEVQSSLKFQRAGARKYIYFNKDEVKAAIVTCGGLCPGLNTVISSVFKCLWINYGIRTIYGIKWGYRGFYEDFPKNWQLLTPESISQIHLMGGTVLGSSRGGFNAELMIDSVKKLGINQLYIIGGDGTHRGIQALQKEMRKQNVQVSIVGIPKTIDNDIPIIDRSFGFHTAVEEAIPFIDSANVEAEAAENGVGIVRLMGRYCGFISVSASLASRDVNICLIPEVHFQLYGPDGVYEAIIERSKVKGQCVVVIAEGAEDGLLEEERNFVREQLGIKQDIKDESGNVKSMDLAFFIKGDLAKYAQDKHQTKLTIKYLDPMYAIRTTKANTDDTVLCQRLGYTAGHGIMAGYTDFSVGIVRDQPVMIPIDVIVEAGSRRLSRYDYEWQRLISSTGQRNFLSPENFVKIVELEKDNIQKNKDIMTKIKSKLAASLDYGGI